MVKDLDVKSSFSHAGGTKRLSDAIRSEMKKI